MAPVIRLLYDQLPNRSGLFRWVVRDFGGVFTKLRDCAGLQPVIPVDVYVRDPAAAGSRLYAILQLQKKIDTKKGRSSAH